MNVAITTSNPWITANNIDSAIITVSVTDGTNKAIGGASVQLSVSQPWSLQDSTGTTPAGGQITTTFLPTTTAGTAVITATVTVPGTTTVPVVQTYAQNVTADIPAKSTNSYSTAGSVGSITDITVRVTDQYGNPVNSRKSQMNVSFTTTNSGDNGFVVPTAKIGAGNSQGGNSQGNTNTVKVKGLSMALNDSGYADVLFALGTHPADNFVSITPPFPLPATLITIQGIANLPPSYIIQAVTPGGNPPTLKTDNSSKFIINYLLSDQYGNPSTGRNLSITTSAGEWITITSNNDGKVTISYGPRTTAGRYVITAKSQDNPKVSAVQTVQFVSGVPTNMVLTASPQSMASLDVKPGAYAFLMAKVIDKQGNPVQGQTVYFSILSVMNGSYIQTQPPSIQGDSTKKTVNSQEVTAVTDGSGNAMATFTPGAFTADTTNPGYSLMAAATAQAQARWGSITHTINLSYKNYPYLSVFTSVNPMTVMTHNTVEVSILIKGDGYALKPKPVNAYLVTDHSGSMSTIDSGNTYSRMDLVKNASMSFMNLFDYSTDRLGQFSFGDTATFDQVLTSNPSLISNAISSLTPSGHTPMRSALYNAITELKKNGSASSVRALVVLSDGDYNWYGDPLALSSGSGSSSVDPTDSSTYYDDTPNWYDFGGGIPQNMAQYASANNIKIYAIGYSTDMTTQGQATLRALAESTGGKYYYALTAADLLTFYAQIAGALRDTAGVNTNMALDFTSVGVNGIPVTPASSVFQYMYIDGVSTRITQPNGTWTTVNSMADWNTGRINLPVGTIKVNQNWMANFTLLVNMSGNIKVLGSSSQVSFQDLNGFQGTIPLPDAYITAIPGTNQGLVTPTFLIYNLRRTNADSDRHTASLAWNILYTGKDTSYQEGISVAPINSIFPNDQYVVSAQNADTSGTYPLIISNLPPGTYKVKVTGRPSDATSSFNTTQFTITIPTNPEIVIR